MYTYVGDQMAADGGAPPAPAPAPEFVHIIKGDQTYDRYKCIKQEQEFDPYNKQLSSSSSSSVESNVGKKVGISIAERRAAKCGFNASNINTSQFRTTVSDLLGTPPPCFTIPSGISPSALLDSPVMLSNAQAQQSPTTGTFQFSAPNHHESSKLKMKSGCNEDGPIGMDQSLLSQHQAEEFQHFVSNNLLVENKLLFEEVEYPKDLKGIAKNDCSLEEILAESPPVVLGNTNKFHGVECSSMQQPSDTKNQMAAYHIHNDQSCKERSIHPHPNQDKYQKGAYFPNKVEVAAKYSEDRFYWRKYGQKHVKGSEYPRSYYKCTSTNCSVRKKVERSHDGQITEIVYKGSHNHPKPQPYKRSFGEMTSDEQMNEGNNGSSCLKTKCTFDWRCDTNGSSSSFLSDISDPISRSTNAACESMDTQEFSSALGSQDGDGQTTDDASLESISFNNEDDENGECEPKKRKRESLSSEIAAIPRVVVQIESDIDILDDGYRWRKYGQKVVKGNPNPRSYYKCTTPACPVRKHVERAANDIKSVITTYEGKHNHDVPCTSKTGVALPSSSQMVHKTTKAGKQLVQHHNLPLYLDRKPILNYNELLLRSNLSNDLLNFGTCSSSSAAALYPLSFPSFHSLPYASSFLMNGDHNHIKSSPSPLVYPMSLPPSSQMDQVPNMPLPARTFNLSNYSALQPPASVTIRGHEIRDSNAITLKPKEEVQHRDDGEPYSTNSSQLSIPEHGTPTGTGTTSIN